MEFYFLNTVFNDLQGKPQYVQVCRNQLGSSEFELSVLSMAQLKELYMKSKSNNNIKFDFVFDDDYFWSDSVPALSYSDNDLNYLKDSKKVIREIGDTIYNLFDTIVELGGYAVTGTSDDELQYFTKFIPRFSENTMTVYIPIKVGKTWVTQKLISVPSDMLVSHEFYFYVKSEFEEHFQRYNLEKIKQYEIGAEVFTVYKYNRSLALCSYPQNDFPNFSAMIARYTYGHELYKCCIKACNQLGKILKAPLYDAEETTRSSTNSRMKEMTSYITFTLSSEKLKNQEYLDMITDISENTMKLSLNNQEDLQQILQRFDNFRYDFIRKLVYLTLHEIISTGGEPTDLLVATFDFSETYLKEQFHYDNVLYRIRASMLYTKYNNNRVYQGSDVPYYAIGGGLCL